MKKMIYAVIFILCLNASNVHAEHINNHSTSQKCFSSINIYVNGNQLNPDVSSFIENNNPFVPIRFIGEALNAKKIQWNYESKETYMEFDTHQVTLSINSNEAIIDNKKVQLDNPVELYKGRTFVSINFLSNTLGYQVNWNPKENTLYVNTNSDYSYSKEDVYWLSRIVEAEACGESYDGKLAVANVVINRKNNTQFPNTIKGVIFDKKYGVQFSPIINGSIYNNPSEDSVKAAEQALAGKNNIAKCLYFCNPKISRNSWIMKNRAFYKKIDNHSFYS